MSDHNMHAINSMSAEISHNMGPIRQDVRQSLTFLEKIVGYFSRLQTTIEEGFARLMENQSLMLIISKSSELSSYSQLMTEQSAVLEKKKANLDNDLEKLSTRYRKLDEELSNNTEATIMKLDGHVIQLNQKYFNNTTAAAYRNYAAPTGDITARYYDDCDGFRASTLDREAQQAAEAVRQFIDQRTAFSREVASYVIDTERPTSEALAMPVFFVRTDHDTLETSLPGRSKIAADKVVYNEDLALGEVKPRVNEAAARLVQRVEFSPLSKNEKEEMKKEIDRWFEKGLLSDTKWVSRRREIARVIDELTTEFGEQRDVR